MKGRFGVALAAMLFAATSLAGCSPAPSESGQVEAKVDAPRTLPPAKRFDELPSSHPFAATVLALNSGEIDRAARLFIDLRPADETDELRLKIGEAIQRAAAEADASKNTGAQLPPKRRFSKIRPEDLLYPAQVALNDGRVDEAYVLYAKSPVTDERRAKPDGVALRAAIQAASDELAGTDRSTLATDAIATDLRPRLQAISETPPTDEVALRGRLTQLEDLAQALSDGNGLKLSDQASAERKAFIAEVSAKQTRVYPVLRRSYVQIRKHPLWLDDVVVEQRGEGGTRVRLTGVLFAANRNIDAVHQVQFEMLDRLRFRRAEYAWADGQEYTFYDLESPADAAVGVWSGDRFVQAE